MKLTIKKNSTISAANKPGDGTTQPHEEAIQYIRSAIAVLCNDAQAGDKIAKESIANLGVVLFDLQ